MTTLTQRVDATPPGVRLCKLGDFAQSTARNFVLQMKAGRFHGLAVRCDGGVVGFVDRCPHAGLPLAQKRDDYLTPDGAMIACSWHGALFRIEDGHCVGGPCTGASLTPWALAIEDGWIVTA